MAYTDELLSLFKTEPLLSEFYKKLSELKEKERKNEVIISVIGQFKRGKSSLINSFLNEELLPVAIIPLTTVVTEIRKGDIFRAFVDFKDKKTLEINKDQLILYCSEGENPKNIKNVERVRIETPSFPFLQNTVLVDTPGVGSVHQHNTQSSMEYVKMSDAVIFLLSVDSPVSETERDFLLSAKEYASCFYFAANKCDLISEDDLSAFISFCKAVISEAMESPAEIYPVSAKKKLNTDALIKKINSDLKLSHEEILNSSIYKKAEIIKEQAKASLNIFIKASSLSSKELSDKLSFIKDKKEGLSSFYEEVQILSKHRTDILVENIREKFKHKCEEIKKETERKDEEIYLQFSSLPPKEFERKAEKELNFFLKVKLTELNSFGISLLDEGYKNIGEALKMKAYENASFIKKLLKEEFGVDYPINETDFSLSSESDFLMHIGLGGTLLIDKDSFNRLLPRKKANERFMKRCIQQAFCDIDFNSNNMVANYRYKMQESLRFMCRELTDYIDGMNEELSHIISHIEEDFLIKEEKREERTDKLNELLRKIS